VQEKKMKKKEEEEEEEEEKGTMMSFGSESFTNFKTRPI
jgi:hypothetical protein